MFWIHFSWNDSKVFPVLLILEIETWPQRYKRHQQGDHYLFGEFFSSWSFGKVFVKNLTQLWHLIPWLFWWKMLKWPHEDRCSDWMSRSDGSFRPLSNTSTNVSVNCFCLWAWLILGWISPGQNQTKVQNLVEKKINRQYFRGLSF